MRRKTEQNDGDRKNGQRSSPSGGSPPAPSPGVIARGETYTLPDFKRRTGLGDNSLRLARRAGLRVIYAHGKAFVLGDDWHAYLERIAQT